MIIETKFNINDEVWLIDSNIVTKRNVTEIEINIDNSNLTFIRYKLNFCENRYLEKELFKTKEELIASL